MAKEKTRNTSKAIEDVEELAGYVTTRKAAEIIGLKWPTMSQTIYDRKVKAVRIGGLILCERQSCEQYRAEREQINAANEQKKAEREEKDAGREKDRELRKRLALLSPEQLEALLAQVEVKS